MQGRLSGVRIKLKSLNPNFFYLGCTSHTFHLKANKAAKTLPLSLENLMKSIYGFFAHSAKRQHQYLEFQEYFDVSKHKILNISSTRWLSFREVISRVLEQWTPLLHYFIQFSFEEGNKHSNITKTVDNIKKGMNDISASAERQFSVMNTIKDKKRNRLHVQTVEALMLSKELVKFENSLEFEPSQQLINFALKFKFTNGAYVE